jgi:membrane fusion protein, multidrug efflux system
MMQRRWWITGVAGVLVLVGAAWMAASRQASAQSKAGRAVNPPLVFTPGEVAQAARRALPRVVEFSGPLVAPDTATVRAKAAGTLLGLQVAEGDRVHRGQRLGELDLADLNARLAERLALLESARAQLAQAERTHASNQHLAEQQFISPVALENSRAALNTARAQVGAAQAQAETIRIALREAALVAPIDGIVAKRQAVPGEKVAAEQPILTVVDLHRLEMSGSVGAHEVGLLRPGMPVSVQVEGADTPISGRLARIAPAADVGTRAIGVAVALTNADEHLRAGQFALARVSLAAAESLAVPQTAVETASGQSYVWALEQGRLVRRSVVTGRRDAASGLVEVLQGLPAGTTVLAAHFDNLREGATARVGTPSAAASAARS